MYRYDEFDAAFVRERTAQFSDQVRRRISGELSEDQFRPLRLMNGLYLQLHAYMLRIAVPYGTLSSKQLRMLAHIARTYDRNYGHFTTRQNIQFNWPKLKDIPQILADLASVEMHAIQTSGNCIRNITTDQFAGAAADEIIDARPVAEILRSGRATPEFSYLPRKFKIAMTGSPNDRAATVPRIGLMAATNEAGDRSVGWRRHGPYADDAKEINGVKTSTCSPISRASCASTTAMGGGTTSTRRGSRSSSTRPGSTRSARKSKRSSPKSRAAC